MSKQFDKHPSSSHLDVGHYSFVQVTGPGSSAPRPGAKDRSTSPFRSRDPSLDDKSNRMSTFGLNVLKNRNKSPGPKIDSQSDVSAQMQSSAQSTSRKKSAPAGLALDVQKNLHNGLGEAYRGIPPPTTQHAASPNVPMSPLPLPPRVPGGGFYQSDASNRSDSRPGSRGTSATTDSRPGTPGTPSKTGLMGSGSGSGSRPSTPGNDKKRRSFFPGSSHKLLKKGVGDPNMSPVHTAFVLGPHGKEPYDLAPLLKGQPVPELWDNNGNMFVHLYPNSNASFRLDSSIIASSRQLQKLILGPRGRQVAMSPVSQMRHLSLGHPISPTEGRSHRPSSAGSADQAWSPTADDEPTELHLQVPLMIDTQAPTEDDIIIAVSTRNMFAFLIGQLIVGTPRMPTLFSIFNHVAAMLKQYEFGNFDGSTMGEAAESAFLGYVADLRLDDVRKSREKTIEALILGERMKCWSLYNEAYVHGVGKWDDLIHLASPLFGSISGRTRSSMEKSAMDLDSRIKSTREYLDNFEFPALFAGFANSRATKQAVDIGSWQNAWQAMRKHVINHYKKTYGNWPPKARSKKNEFEESGLNRILLQSVYQDFTDLYDMLVDRTSLSERSLDASHGDALADDTNLDHLRKLLSEFDRSISPVRPPIPYDIPKLPSLSAINRDFNGLSRKKQEKERNRKLKDNDLTLTLMDSYNRDSLKSAPFCESFMAFERHLAHGRTTNELVNIRIGIWIFLYVVLQSLPLLVVDAPNLRWTKGVEYFLCQVPKGSPPWMPEQQNPRAFYRVAGTGGVVSMPADAVEHGVDGIYRRSHCWVAASRWSGQDAGALLPGNTGRIPEAASSAAMAQTNPALSSGDGSNESRVTSISGLTGMSGSGGTEGLLSIDGARGGAQRPRSRNSMMPGLEALPMPPSLKVDGLGGGTRASTIDPTKSFDDILKQFGPGEDGKSGKKGKK